MLPQLQFLFLPMTPLALFSYLSPRLLPGEYDASWPTFAYEIILNYGHRHPRGETDPKWDKGCQKCEWCVCGGVTDVTGNLHVYVCIHMHVRAYIHKCICAWLIDSYAKE